MSINVIEQKTVLKIEENGNSITVNPVNYVVKVQDVGAQGGSGSSGNPYVFIQNSEPTVETGFNFLWVQTGLGDGTDFSVFAGTGA